MIKRIQIENFKSFGKVDLEPHPRVNLLIGPNSSGKSNFLEAISYFHRFSKNDSLSQEFSFLLRKKNKFSMGGDFPFISLEIDGLLVGEGTSKTSILKNLAQISIKLNQAKAELNLKFADEMFNKITYSFEGVLNSNLGLADFIGLSAYCSFLKPDLKAMRGKLLADKFQSFETDLSNLVTFIDTLRDDSEELWNQYCDTFYALTSEYKRVSKRQSSEKGYFELQFQTAENVIFGPNEVSDGILLFAGLLAILHQPNPPKVILLEEPENGIHPRRLSEIISLIWKLAEEKDVQFFITTHSPVILDQFSESPECVWVFDKKKGITEIQNLEKIIEAKHAFAKANGLPELDYTAELSENWLWGLLNGVPDILQS